MPSHGLVTRLKKKTEEPPREPRKEPREPVRLTNDLLYLVNKKLEQKDKIYRKTLLDKRQKNQNESESEESESENEQECFTEITYRESKIQLSEIGPGTATKLKSKVMIFRATPK